MKIIVTKEELLDFSCRCAEMVAESKGCVCPFSAECDGAYIDFWRDNTEIKESDSK